MRRCPVLAAAAGLSGGGSGGLRVVAVRLDAVLSEQGPQPPNLAVYSLVLLDDRLDVHAGDPLPLASPLVGEQLLLAVAQRRGRGEVSRVDRRLLLPAGLGDLLGVVVQVGRRSEADQPVPAEERGDLSLQRGLQQHPPWASTTGPVFAASPVSRPALRRG